MREEIAAIERFVSRSTEGLTAKEYYKVMSALGSWCARRLEEAEARLDELGLWSDR